GALRIPLTLDPAAIPVNVQETSPVYLPLPDDDVATEVPVSLFPAGEEEHVYSASELEQYLRCPVEYERRYRLGLATPPVRAASAGEDAMTRGLVVHEVFRGRDPAAVLRRYGMDPGRAGEYRELYERFRASPLMQGNTRDHCEVPFLARVRGVACRGVIDRLAQRSDGAWVLIDYKTGTPGNAGDYAVQMTVYRHAAGQILGQPVTAYLYFVDADRWMEVAVDEERVFDTIEQAVRGIEQGTD
ncbi:MAG: PD-(D/E)XK nuclease family protein, partial [Methanoculleus sp.]|nr:PD-(D/E)XK nuclease family protein [Methanoculleus sp.]